MNWRISDRDFCVKESFFPEKRVANFFSRHSQTGGLLFVEPEIAGHPQHTKQGNRAMSFNQENAE